MNTVGAVVKQKFANFTVFAQSDLKLATEQTLQLQTLNNLPAEVLLASLNEFLQPCKSAIEHQSLPQLQEQLQQLEQLQHDPKQLSLLLHPFESANQAQTALIWRYLNCFLELSDLDC
jgi:hypothetical protein